MDCNVGWEERNTAAATRTTCDSKLRMKGAQRLCDSVISFDARHFAGNSSPTPNKH